MKKHLLLSLIFTLLCGVIFSQHLIRVNNNPGADADYLTLQAANDNANAGDTIYIEGSTTGYESANIDRKLTIIGPGYFLASNDSTQANSLQANCSSINFMAGSAGSKIMGITSSISIGVSNIVVTRCNVSSIYINDIVENILISQNYVYQVYCGYGGQITNSVITNNLVDGSISASGTSGSLQITNNVIFSTYSTPIDVYNSNIANNITCATSYKIAVNTGNNISNNISAATGTNENGNLYSIPMTSVFVDYSGSLGYSQDAKWKLKATSPAIGAGISGVDCGAFGAVTPYVLSGVPPLPHIYEAAIPGTAYSDKAMNCTIKVKSGK